MATSTGRKKCLICAKERQTAKCSGCLQDFCLNHLVEHHQQLEQEFHNLENESSSFRQTLTEQQTRRGEQDSLMKQINQWETESIRKIQQAAEEQRQILSNFTSEHLLKIESQFSELSEKLKKTQAESDFNEIILTKLQSDFKQLEKQLHQPALQITVKTDSSSFIEKIFVSIIDTQLTIQTHVILSRWKQDGITVVGGNGCGNNSNQCSDIWSICISDEKTIYVADTLNHRIVRWKTGAKDGKTVAGGNGEGGRYDQLAYPYNMIIDYQTNSFVIADRGNKRVVRWPCRKGKSGEVIISNVHCWGLTIDSNGYLYVSDIERHEVRRWKIGEKDGVVVAGGNGRGDQLNQLDAPRYICIDKDETIYVSDDKNHRVVKWLKGANEGVIVAGGQGKGSSLSQLSNPQGILVDQLGTVYIADLINDRVMRWLKGASEGAIVVGGNASGQLANQFDGPTALAFDAQNNLYVADRDNHRVQKFLTD